MKACASSLVPSSETTIILFFKTNPTHLAIAGGTDISFQTLQTASGLVLSNAPSTSKKSSKADSLYTKAFSIFPTRECRAVSVDFPWR